MDYINVKDAAKKWNLTDRSVQKYCVENKIPGAKYIGKQWLIPADAEKPMDGRTKSFKKLSNFETYHYPMFHHSPYYSRKSELSANELELLEAEILYCNTEYSKSFIKCKSLLDKKEAPHVVFGAYILIGYISLISGMFNEYVSTVKTIKSLVQSETLHRADYNFMYKTLLMFSDKRCSRIKDIDPTELSFDALPEYKYVLLTSHVQDHEPIRRFSIQSYLVDLRMIESMNIEPLMVSYYAMIGILYLREDKITEANLYFEKAVGLSAEKNLLGKLTMYYVVTPDNFDPFIDNYDSSIRSKLQRLLQEISINWTIVFKALRGITPAPELTLEENEYIFLYYNDVTEASMVLHKGVPIDHIKAIKESIMKKMNLKNNDEFKEYVNKVFDTNVNQ